MLLEFGCDNFRSFQGGATLSMLPVNAYKELPDNLAPVKPTGYSSSGVLCATAVFGANASGKSNLLKAMDFAKSYVMGGTSFAGNPFHEAFVGQSDKPSRFWLSILIDKTKYYYEFLLDSNGIVRETLKAQPKLERLVFERTRTESGRYEIKQGSKYSGITTKLKDFSDNGPVLGLLSKFGVEDCSTVFHWIQHDFRIIDHSMPVDYGTILKKLRDLGEDNFSKAVEAIQSADLGITGAQLAESDFSDEELENQKVLTDKVKAIFEALTGENVEEIAPADKKIIFQLQHRIGSQQIGFGFDNESLGTITMLNLAAEFLDAISNGRTLVVDEIERSLHPVLLNNLVSLFFDRELNDKNAQLIFTTHDLSLMNEQLLRRDQIWFVEKNQDTGSSELYPLSDFSPRKEDNILNRYLYGAYGAIPFIERVL